MKQDNWERVTHSIYRLVQYEWTERPDLIVLTLLSMNRQGEPQAVASHETALAIHDISDANPARIHLTVPPNFRKKMPPAIRLHRDNLTPNEWVQCKGYRVTTSLRTIIDTARSEVIWPFLDGAVRDALRLGLTTESELWNYPLTGLARTRIVSTLTWLEHSRAKGA